MQKVSLFLCLIFGLHGGVYENSTQHFVPKNPAYYLSGFSGEVKSVGCESNDEAKVLHLSEESNEVASN